MPPPRLEVRRSSIAEAWNHGLEDMVARHYEEVPNGLPLDIDWPQYRKLERAGAYVPFAAFTAEGRLVGYSAFFVQPTPQHRSTLQAVNDVIFMEPAYRACGGLRLLREPEATLREMGARRVIYYSHPDMDKHGIGAKLARLLSRVGYPPVETAHAKLL